jgi:hypothetical protein
MSITSFNFLCLCLVAGFEGQDTRYRQNRVLAQLLHERAFQSPEQVFNAVFFAKKEPILKLHEIYFEIT